MIKWCQTVWRDFHSTVHHIPPWSHSFNYSLSRRTPTETSWKSVKKCFIKYFKKNCLLSSQRTKQAVILSHRILLSPEIPSTWIFVWHFSFLLSPFTQSHDTGIVSCLCFAAFLMRIPLRELVCNTFHFFPFKHNFATEK